MSKGVPGFEGVKVTPNVNACVHFPFLKKVEIADENCDAMLFERKGLIGCGGNSGFQALNLVAQMEPRRIILVGFDVRLDEGVHWHGPHGNGLGNPKAVKMMRWRKALNGAAEVLSSRGIKVLNASPVSTLTEYEFCNLEDLL